MEAFGACSTPSALGDHFILRPAVDAYPGSMPVRLTATDAEQISFEQECRDAIMRRLRKGLPSTIAVAAAIVITTWWSYPQLGASVVTPTLAGLVVLCLGAAASRAPAMRRFALPLCFALGWGVTAVASVAAAPTGEFLSPFYNVVYLIWLFALSFMPFSPAQILSFCAPQPFIAYAVFVALGLGHHVDALPIVINAGALLYAFLGVVVRHREALESFVAQARLATASVSVSKLNAELEGRVQAQVAEIMKRASDVEALNGQLRLRVAERSRELALALRHAAAKTDDGKHVLSPGTLFANRLLLRERLGEGGMGIVFAADDRVTGRTVAVKVMGGALDAASLRRFLVEAEAAATIADPAIVKTLHVDVDASGRAFLIQELVEGVTLHAFALQRARHDPGVVARIGAGIASAVAAAHAAGIIHRDVKPSNVMLCRQSPAIRVLDFGISKIQRTDDATVTAAAGIMGTPAYMAPEQARDASGVSAACDVYALGVVLFELATGSLPFEGVDPIATLIAHATRPLRDPRELVPDLPEVLAELILAALARDPERRPRSDVLAAGLAAIADELRAPRAESLREHYISCARAEDAIPTRALPAGA